MIKVSCQNLITNSSSRRFVMNDFVILMLGCYWSFTIFIQWHIFKQKFLSRRTQFVFIRVDPILGVVGYLAYYCYSCTWYLVPWWLFIAFSGLTVLMLDARDAHYTTAVFMSVSPCLINMRLCTAIHWQQYVTKRFIEHNHPSPWHSVASNCTFYAKRNP